MSHTDLYRWMTTSEMIDLSFDSATIGYRPDFYVWVGVAIIRHSPDGFQLLLWKTSHPRDPDERWELPNMPVLSEDVLVKDKVDQIIQCAVGPQDYSPPYELPTAAVRTDSPTKTLQLNFRVVLDEFNVPSRSPGLDGYGAQWVTLEECAYYRFTEEDSIGDLAWEAFSDLSTTYNRHEARL